MSIFVVRRGRFSLVMITAVLAIFLIASPLQAAPLFGPGNHWVDTMTAGTDSFSSIMVVVLDLDGDSVEDFTFSLPTSMIIQRGAASDTPDVLDPGHNNHVDIELVSMELTAGFFTIRAGDGVANLASDGPLYSPGAIDEQAGDTALADAYIDFSFEIETLVGTFNSGGPVRLEAVIDQYPPVFSLGHFQVIPLLDSGGGGTPAQVLGITTQVIPEPSSLALLGIGGMVLAAFGMRRRRRAA